MAWIRGYYRRTSHSATWVKGHSRSSPAGILFLVIAGLAIGAIYLIFIVLKAFLEMIIKYWYPISIACISVFILILIVLIVRLIVRSNRKRKTRELIKQLNEAIDVQDYTQDKWTKIRTLRSQLSNSTELLDPLQQAYRHIISSFVDDGEITDKELQKINRVEDALALSSDIVSSTRYDGFLEVFHQAISDGALTEPTFRTSRR
jgi:uncharacterized membrane-anchored protein YhcB (DUF1043 family)